MKVDSTQSRFAVRGVNQRDAGLRLIARANRWMISGAVVLAAGVSAVTAHAFQARASASASAVPLTVGAPTSQARSGDSDSDHSALASSPAPAPAPAPAASPVVSGGS